ncbi:hypothetical protein RJ641_017454 [Dillenia turbinata]|uniref:Epidermal patterning factor-like protein n=1 Tax=Dillenia turbinata TaxID=194707 RepID=A0AAN8V127_9MAGN
MKGFLCVAILILILTPGAIFALRIHRLHSHHGHHQPTTTWTKDGALMIPDFFLERMPMKHKRTDPLQIAGSSLPDCSHACGSCTPCRLVMVSFVCASLEEAETCPIAYKCMCKNKSYPVP